jgi:thiamine biosynthesis lipoprotein
MDASRLFIYARSHPSFTGGESELRIRSPVALLCRIYDYQLPKSKNFSEAVINRHYNHTLMPKPKSHPPFSAMTRRSFLAMPAMVPALARAGSAGEHRFSWDHVLGTSMDLVVRTSEEDAAKRAEQAVLAEIERLSAILATRDPESEISRLAAGARPRSRALGDVFSAYEEWERRAGGAFSIRPGGSASPLNVDALGKAYILDRALDAVRLAAPFARGALVNIGGDIVAWREPSEVEVIDPRCPFDNAPPLTRVLLDNAAIATSGAYARGAHLMDPRSGAAIADSPSATVIAADTVTANALATTLCVLGSREGLRLVESTPGAEALVVERDGTVRRSSGFERFEIPRMVPVGLAAGWPKGNRLSLSLTITDRTGAAGGRGLGRAFKRHYVAVWAENTASKVVRVIAFWADQEKYFGELSIFFNRSRSDLKRMASLARATRLPGRYDLLWDGTDDRGMPAPAEAYKIVVETNQEGGSYAKQSGSILCGDNPAEIRLASTVNFEAIHVRYGPPLEGA